MVLLRSFIPPRSGGQLKPTFNLFKGTGFNGVDNLSPNLTINGITVSPTIRYKGGDADATDFPAWGYGPDLSLAGAGAEPTPNQGSPCLGANDDSVCINNGKYYNHAAGTAGDITTGDFVIVCVLKHNDSGGGGGGIINKDGSPGWSLRTGADNVTFVLDDGGGAQTETGTAGHLVVGSWYMITVVCNRDEAGQSGLKVYINGVLTGNGLDASASNLTLANSDPLNIGALNNFFSAEACVAYCAVYEQADWIQAGATGQTEAQAVLLTEFNKLIGIHPAKASGTKTPTVQTRATTAYLDKIEGATRKLYNVGASWMRIVSREDSASTAIEGYLPETAATNLALQSEDLGTTWAQIDVGDTIGGSVVTPNKSTNTTAGLIPDATDGPHGVNQDITLTAATYAFTVWAKKGTHDWLLIDNDTIANGKVWFDLANGVIGTEEAGITDAHIHDYGDGWYQCHYIFTGTVAAHSLEIRVADADNTTTASGGDGAAIALYAWGAQCELGENHSSYIPTTTGTVTRNKDELQYKGDDGNISNNLKSTLACDILVFNFDNASDAYVTVISDGGSADDRVTLFLQASTDVARTQVLSTEDPDGSVTGTTDISDDVIKSLRSAWQTNGLTLYVDGASEGTPDTSVTPPNDLDELNVGQNRGGGAQLCGVISNLRIFKKVTLKG